MKERKKVSLGKNEIKKYKERKKRKEASISSPSLLTPHAPAMFSSRP
jgi:hypothetical protein